MVPYLLGFAPAESVVIVGISDSRVIVTGRVDLAAGRDEAATVLDRILAQSDTAISIAYTEQPVPQWLCQPLDELRDSLLVSDGRWYSLMCTDATCCPPEGRALPTAPSVAATIAVSVGIAPAAGREDITTSLAPGAVTVAATERAAQLTPIPARDAAWLALDAHLDDRDELTAQAAGYLDTARHCPQDERAAAAWFLYAWAQWRLGDGARAAIALEYLEAGAPVYSAADLLSAALRMGLHPHTTPAISLQADASAELADAIDALGEAVGQALTEAQLPWTREADAYSAAGCMVGLNYRTGRPEVWNVEADADTDRVANALAGIQVAARDITQPGGVA
jgi:hypothetical protein